MGYEPLHHKYRPQTFADLVGQDAIATTLIHAIESQRIAPAYLFTGPRGTGKTSSARILAKSLNCLNSEHPTPSPCGRCSVCQDIARGDALDVIEIDAASNTGVDNIRDLIERAQFAPVQCRYKIYCLDEVHMLSTAAFNALLKTLEEPPAQVVFVLATTDPQRVLATIISRCQRFDFRRIPLSAMVGHLAQIAAQENIAITTTAIELIAQIAQGGLRDAESLLDQLSLLSEEVTPEHIWDLVGSVPERDLLVLLQAIMAQQPEAILSQTQQLLNRGREPLIVLQNLTSFYRDLLIAKTAPNRRDLVAITESTWEELCQFSQSIDLALILHGQQHLRTCEPQIKNTTQPRLWLEVGLLGLLSNAASPTTAPTPVQSVNLPVSIATTPATTSAAPPQVIAATSQPLPTASPPAPPPAPPPAASSSLASRPEHSASEVLPAASPVPASVPEASPAPAVLQPSAVPPIPTPPPVDHHQLWQQVLAHLNPAGKALFTQYGQLESLQGGQAEISILKSLVKTAQGKVPEVEAAFEKLIHRSVRVNLVVNSGTAQAPQSQLQAQPPASATPPTALNSAPSSVGTLGHTAQPVTSSASPPPAPAQTGPPHPAPNAEPSASTRPPASEVVAAPLAMAPPAPTNPGWDVEDQFTQNARSFAQFFGGILVDTDAEELIEQ